MYRFFKRAFAFFASLLALIVTSPIWLITVIGIEISDPGPVFYKAETHRVQGTGILYVQIPKYAGAQKRE